jgi:preprotein translocase subunit Sec61beta
MSSDRISIGSPQSSAGIMGISSGTNLGGIKFNPRGVVLFSAIFIILVKVADYLVANRMI